MKCNNTRHFVLTALFAAMILLLGFTPMGLIPLGFINITILCVTILCMIAFSIFAVKFSVIFYILISGTLGLIAYLIGRAAKREEETK